MQLISSIRNCTILLCHAIGRYPSHPNCRPLKKGAILLTLYELCTHITTAESTLLKPDHKLGARLVCPEYSKSVQEIKTYPLPPRERIFALCWNINPARPVHIPFKSPDSCGSREVPSSSFGETGPNLYATLCPSPEPFCYRLHFCSGRRTQLHTHDYIELAYVVEGEFRQRILGHDIVFSRGDLCLIDKNCLHQDYLLDQPAIILFLGIANDMFSEIMDETVATQKIISFLQSALLKQKDLQQYLHFRPGADSGAVTDLENCLGLLLDELHENKIGSHYICKGLLLRIFRIISSCYDFSLSKEQRKTMNWIVFEEVSDYIKHHFATVTIQELVKEFHFQEDYFNRLIKSKTGLTYSAYVQQIRLEHAAHMLTATHKSVDEITELAGYHNKGYFYKIFQEKYGMTPSGYRKHNDSTFPLPEHKNEL